MKISICVALRVVYQGNFHLHCDNCCNRWFFTFNGAECSDPLPIDAAWYLSSHTHYTHRHGAIKGYCDNIHKGKIRVGINIGNCPGYGNSDGSTGWMSVSRLIIEEAPRPQYNQLFICKSKADGIRIEGTRLRMLFIFFSARERAEFNKSCNLIGSWSGRNSLIRTATAGGIHRVDLFS